MVSVSDYCRAPFFEGYKFREWSKKKVHGNYFHETTLGTPFTIHVNLHKIKFSVKQIVSWKSQKSAKFMALEKERPMVCCNISVFVTCTVTVDKNLI